MWTKIFNYLCKRPTSVATVKPITGTSVPPKREFYIQPSLPLDFPLARKNG